MAVIAIADGEEARSLGRFGLEGTPALLEGWSRGVVLDEGRPLVVEDARSDDRFASNPLVVEAPQVRFYAGAPLRTPEGRLIGVLAAMDVAPRIVDTRQRLLLELLAQDVERQLEVQRRADAQNAMLDGAPFVIAYWDRSQRCLAKGGGRGAAARPALGMTLKEFWGQSYAFHRPHVEGALGGAEHVAEGGPDAEGLRAQYVPHFAGERVLGFTLIVSDVSEARRAAQQQFRAALDAAPNPLLLVDREGGVRHANQAALQLFGYEAPELLGASVSTLVPRRFAERHEAHVAGFFGDPKTRAMGAGRDLFAARKDGTEVPVEIGLNPIRTPEGDFTLAAVVDLSERNRAAALREQLAAIVESSADAIIGEDASGMIVAWNRGAERLLGWSAVEAIGRSAGSLLVPADLGGEAADVLRGLRSRAETAPFETRLMRKDGAQIPVSATLSAIRRATGDIEGLAAIFRDISEQQARDEELRRSNAELEQFAYVASHDLQEPLRMVANYTELLARRFKGKLDESADKYIFYASDGARRMQRLVADLLAYSRVGSQGKPLFDVAADMVVRDVLASLRVLIEEAEAEVDVGPLPRVRADDVQLAQLFQNLIANSIKFRSEARPHLSVRARLEGRFVVFSVSDNGIGFEMDYAARVFLMFQRLHARGEYQGSGMGLAIAKRIVERHGGSIWVESTPGVGTTFHFTLSPARGLP